MSNAVYCCLLTAHDSSLVTLVLPVVIALTMIIQNMESILAFREDTTEATESKPEVNNSVYSTANLKHSSLELGNVVTYETNF